MNFMEMKFILGFVIKAFFYELFHEQYIKLAYRIIKLTSLCDRIILLNVKHILATTEF